jgi:hypothetical protein
MKTYISQGNYLESTGCSNFKGFMPWWEKARLDIDDLQLNEEQAKEWMKECMPPGFGGGNSTRSKGFTKGIKKRLGSELATCDFSTAIFLTLTQSSNEGLGPRPAKKLLDNFGKRMVTAGKCGIWRLEKQESGNPHFHIILWGQEKCKALQIKKDIDTKKKGAWFIESDEFTDIWHSIGKFKKRPRCEVAPIWSSTGAYLYLVGHSSKACQTWEGQDVGKYWGWFGYDMIPRKERKELELDEWDEWVLKLLWNKKECRRVKWLKIKKNVDAEPRDWLRGNVKLWSRDPVRVLERVQRRFKKKG